MRWSNASGIEADRKSDADHRRWLGRNSLARDFGLSRRSPIARAFVTKKDKGRRERGWKEDLPSESDDRVCPSVTRVR